MNIPVGNLNPVSFLLNQSDESKENSAVVAPAFSLTKVLVTGATVVAPVTALLVKEFTSADLDLTNANLVALAIGLLGFMAVIASADVLARGIATSGAGETKAAEARRANFVKFSTPLPANHANKDVHVIGLADGPTQFFLLRLSSGDVDWAPTSDVEVGKPAPGTPLVGGSGAAPQQRG